LDADVNQATEEALVSAGMKIQNAETAVTEASALYRVGAARTGRAWRTFGKGFVVSLLNSSNALCFSDKHYQAAIAVSGLIEGVSFISPQLI
jgi:hypothetical protein